MDVSLMREYMVLAQTLSFTKAARLLNTTQSTLSKHLASLEREVGTQLLDRNTAHVELTPEGRRFLEEAHNVVESYDRALNKTLTAPGIRRQSIKINGVFHPQITGLLTTGLLHLRQNATLVDVLTTSQSWATVSDMLKHDNADIFFFIGSDNLDLSDFVAQPLFRDRIGAVLPADHPLARSTSIPLEALAEKTFMRASGCITYDNWYRMEELCRLHHIEPHTRYVKVSTPADLFSLPFLDSISFIALSELPYLPMLQVPEIAVVEIEDEDCYFEYYIAYRKNTPRGVIPEFVETLRGQTLPFAAHTQRTLHSEDAGDAQHDRNGR